MKTPNCGGGSAVALRLNPGAWRNGMRGLSTTLTRPSGLERCSTTRAWGMRRVCDSPLYGDITGATQAWRQQEGQAAP